MSALFCLQDSTLGSSWFLVSNNAVGVYLLNCKRVFGWFLCWSWPKQSAVMSLFVCFGRGFFNREDLDPICTFLGAVLYTYINTSVL